MTKNGTLNVSQVHVVNIPELEKHRGLPSNKAMRKLQAKSFMSILKTWKYMVLLRAYFKVKFEYILITHAFQLP